MRWSPVRWVRAVRAVGLGLRWSPVCSYPSRQPLAIKETSADHGTKRENVHGLVSRHLGINNKYKERATKKQTPVPHMADISLQLAIYSLYQNIYICIYIYTSADPRWSGGGISEDPFSVIALYSLPLPS